MALTTVTEVHPEYLKATVEGDWDREAVFRLIEEIKAEADRVERTCILTDMRRVEGNPSVMDRFDTGDYLATVMRFRYKIAVIARAEYITNLGKIVATSRGADMNVLPTEEEAIQWLLS